jgi:perosamine synthetase
MQCIYSLRTSGRRKISVGASRWFSKGVIVMSKSKLAISGGVPAVDHKLHKRWPEILEQDRNAVLRVLNSNVLAGLNAPEVTALQREYAEVIGVRHALALNSGTAALHCALVAAGVEPGDEVIVPVYSFVASAMSILHAGAVPVFVDIDERTFNINPALIEERITSKTKAIMVVHIHGMPADMDEVMAVANRRGLKVIEDCAQSHATKYKGRNTGTFGFVGATSLSASKNLPGGEGGLVYTDDDDAMLSAKRLCCFGEDLVPLEKRKFWSHGVGWNYRTTEITSAFTREQLKRLLAYNAQASVNGARLSTLLEGVNGVKTPHVPEDRECNYWKYMITLDLAELGVEKQGKKKHQVRDRIIQALRAEGCDPMVWQAHPMAAQPVFRRKALPWTRRRDKDPLKPWDPAEYPVCSRLLDVSFSLSNENYQLYVQPPEIIEQYAEAVRKVVKNLDEVMSMPFTPVEWPANPS